MSRRGVPSARAALMLSARAAPSRADVDCSMSAISVWIHAMMSSTGSAVPYCFGFSSVGRGIGFGFDPLPPAACHNRRFNESATAASRYSLIDHDGSSSGFSAWYSCESRPRRRHTTHRSRRLNPGVPASRRRRPSRIRSYSSASVCSSTSVRRPRVPPA